MAKRTFLAGATSQTIDIFIADATSTIGAGLSGLVWNTSGLTAYYRKGAIGTPTAITLATQTVGGAWSSGGFVELDAVHTKGLYRLDVPDTVLASTPSAIIYLYGAANMVPDVSELEIVSYNPFTANLGLMAVQMTESYAALGVAPTEAQILFEIRALLAEKAVSGTTLTAKKINGSTTAETFTLDSATAPTSITRAS